MFVKHKACPHCGKRIKQTAQVCPYCCRPTYQRDPNTNTILPDIETIDPIERQTKIQTPQAERITKIIGYAIGFFFPMSVFFATLFYLYSRFGPIEPRQRIIFLEYIIKGFGLLVTFILLLIIAIKFLYFTA